MNQKMKYRFFGIVAIVFLCIGLTYKYFQNDTFYIIKLGEFISRNGIDLVDHYSWVANLSYTYPHWLYDLVIYEIYHNFSYLGVYVSTIIMFIVLVLCIYLVHLKSYKNELLAVLIAVISVFRLSMFAVARAQIVSLPLFLLEVYFLNQLSVTGKKRYIIYVAFCSLVIANVHATVWLFFFVLFLPFLGEHFVKWLFDIELFKKLYKINYNKNGAKVIIEKNINLKKILVALGVSFLIGLLTPSRICYSYVFKVMQGNSQDILTEHFPLVVMEHPFFLVIIAILLVVFIFTKTKIYLKEIFMIGGLFLMCLISVRHLSFFYTIGLLYIVIICNRYLEENGDKTLEILGNFIFKKKVIWGSLLVVIVIFSGVKFLEHSKEEYVLRDEYPVGAVSYIKNNLNYQEMRLFNGYNYGSYLLFKDIPVFIDSRCDLYLKEFNGMNYSIFNVLSDIVFNYEEVFAKHEVSHVLVSKSEVLSVILLKDSNYKTIYKDEYFVLFERLVVGEV